MSRPLKATLAILAVLALVVLGIVYASNTTHTRTVRPAQKVKPPIPGKPSGPKSTVIAAFNYGFDLSNQEPDSVAVDPEDVQNVPSAVESAQGVLRQFAGSMMDQSLYDFGANADPEPSPGHYNLTSLTSRIDLITSAGGIPVITLVGAPRWMRSDSCDPDTPNGALTPPCPGYYEDFAQLCAYVARAFPQVKYFVVWNEFKGFYSHNSVDIVDYTDMYNDVYAAVKRARPDALIGGPYAPFSAYPCTQFDSQPQLRGAWGCILPTVMVAFSYWLSHKSGADFIAIDGATAVAKSDNAALMNPVTAGDKYAAVDYWIRARSSLPIWWMESQISPNSGWSVSEGVAARIATLALMNTSGAAVGMQWQPQEQSEVVDGERTTSDEGLWTGTVASDGGRPTPLAMQLLQALPVLRTRLALVAGEPAGVLVAHGGRMAILVNGTSQPAEAMLNGGSTRLGPYQVIVE